MTLKMRVVKGLPHSSQFWPVGSKYSGMRQA
jgi:hypothetical protein